MPHFTSWGLPLLQVLICFVYALQRQFPEEFRDTGNNFFVDLSRVLRGKLLGLEVEPLDKETCTWKMEEGEEDPLLSTGIAVTTSGDEETLSGDDASTPSEKEKP